MNEKNKIQLELLESFKKKKLNEINGIEELKEKKSIKKYFKYLKYFFIFFISFTLVGGTTFLLLKYFQYKNYVKETEESIILAKIYLEEQKIKEEEEKRLKEELEQEMLLREKELKEIENNDFHCLNELPNEKKEVVLNLIPSGYPLKKVAKVTSPFGIRIHPVWGIKRMHYGIDLKVYTGEDILSSAMGVVSFAGVKRGYGYVVIIDHIYGFQTLYAHLSKIYVKVGDIVGKGKIIAAGGNSGVSTGSHLHYEVKYNGLAMDPKNFIEWNKDSFDNIFEKEKNVPWTKFLSIMGK